MCPPHRARPSFATAHEMFSSCRVIRPRHPPLSAASAQAVRKAELRHGPRNVLQLPGRQPPPPSSVGIERAGGADLRHHRITRVVSHVPSAPREDKLRHGPRNILEPSGRHLPPPSAVSSERAGGAETLRHRPLRRAPHFYPRRHRRVGANASPFRSQVRQFGEGSGEASAAQPARVGDTGQQHFRGETHRADAGGGDQGDSVRGAPRFQCNVVFFGAPTSFFAWGQGRRGGGRLSGRERGEGDDDGAGRKTGAVDPRDGAKATAGWVPEVVPIFVVAATVALLGYSTAKLDPY